MQTAKGLKSKDVELYLPPIKKIIPTWTVKSIIVRNSNFFDFLEQFFAPNKFVQTVSATHPYCSMDVGIDDDEFVWTKIRENKPIPLHRGLQELESCMRCQICGSFFHSPVSVQGCFHTFCSECIRGAIRAGKLSIRRTALCPICRNPIDGNVNDCLLPNRSVEEMVYKFKQLRGNLIATLAGSPESSPSVLHHNDFNQNNVTDTLKSATNHKESGEERENSDPDRIIAAMEPRKKIPKTFYNGMKRKKLQEKCRELGLSDQGTDHELKSRHQDYVTLYNAECDSLHPRSPLELVRMIHEREKAIREEKCREMISGIADHGTLLKRIKETCKAVGEGSNVEITSGNAAFDEKLSLGFKSLCTQLKKRKQEKLESLDYPTTEGNEPSKKKKKNFPPDSKPHANNSIENCDKKKEYQSSEKNARPKSNTLDSVGECLEGSNLSIASKVNDEETSQKFKSSNVSTTASTPLRSPHFAPQVAMLCDDTRNPINNSSSTDTDDSNSIIQVSPSNSSKASPMVTHKSIHNHHMKRVQSRLLKRNHIADNSLPSTIGPWNCSKCTFYNEALIGSRAKCEICGNPRAKYAI